LAAQDLSQKLAELGTETIPFEFYSFSGVQFQLAGATAQIVEPDRWAPGKPWIWRARFWGHQPALDLALLERGFGLAYCDVQYLYGSPQAVARWNAFYDVTQKLELNSKPILEGMSRGGLIVFNWAKANPGKVCAIYADNPVCDIRSWPGKQSPADWRRCLATYGLTDLQAATFAGNPIDDLKPLADARVPVYLVLGEDDQIVPPEENALELARRYQALGGSVRTWIKPGQGHHPHGLDPVTLLLNQLLLASPRAELQPLPVGMLTDKKRILMLGDSITYRGDYVSYLATWAKLAHDLPARRFLNLGLPSETVSGLSEAGHADGKFPRPDLHERLDRVLNETKPNLIFACYGINCGIYEPYDADRIEAYEQGLQMLKKAADERAIELVFLTPPTYDSKRQEEKAYYEGVMHSYANWLIAQQEKGWRVIDVHYAMQRALDTKRESDPDFTFQPDAVHPNDAGHRAMAAAIISSFDPNFDIAQFDAPTYRSQYAKTHSALKANHRNLLESTRHRRPGVPGYWTE
jgi:pimeloyl-ACP methyl ester carboxylesterase